MSTIVTCLHNNSVERTGNLHLLAYKIRDVHEIKESDEERKLHAC
jgi:hypothetical protein